MKRLGWVKIEAGNVIKTGDPAPSPIELALKNPDAAPADIKKDLLKRGLVTEEESVRYTITITDEGKNSPLPGSHSLKRPGP